MTIQRVKRNGQRLFVALMDETDLNAVLEALNLWLLVVSVQEQIDKKRGDPSLKREKISLPLFEKDAEVN